MSRLAVLLLSVPIAIAGGAPLNADAPSAAAAPASPWAALTLSEVTHALEDRTLVISGSVRNSGRLPVSGLVIDASGFSPSGDLAAFGSDGIPWTMRPEAEERFRIFLPLERTLVSAYTLTVTASRPRQERPATVTRAIFPRFYRPLILPRVRVNVSAEAYALTFNASAEDLPVTAVEVSVQLLIDELRGAAPDFRVLNVVVPVNRPMRMRFTPLIVKVVSVSVVDVVLAQTWAVP